MYQNIPFRLCMETWKTICFWLFHETFGNFTMSCPKIRFLICKTRMIVWFVAKEGAIMYSLTCINSYFVANILPYVGSWTDGKMLMSLEFHPPFYEVLANLYIKVLFWVSYLRLISWLKWCCSVNNIVFNCNHQIKEKDNLWAIYIVLWHPSIWWVLKYFHESNFLLYLHLNSSSLVKWFLKV